MVSQGFTTRRPVPVSPEPLESRLLPCSMEALPPPADLGFAFPPATVDATVSVTGDDPGPGPGLPARPGAEWTTGLKRILYVRVTFSDKPARRPQTVASARNSMAFADAFFRANSFGQTSLRTTFTDVIVLPRPESFYATGQWERLRTDALAAAKAIRPAWDAKNYEHDVMRYDGGPAPLGGGAAGFANTNGRGTWLRTDEPAAAVHELGHNLGLNHANFWEGADGDAPAGPGKHFEYGNSYSIMGAGGAAGLDGHFNAYEKNFLHWLPDEAVQTADQSGRYTVRAADSGRLPAPGEFAALKIRKDLLRTYWLSSRATPFWATNGSLSGLEVDWGAWSKDARANSALGSHLLDMTPGPWADRFDYGLPLGHTFTDESIGLHFTPLSRDAAGTVEVAVEYDWDQEESNVSAPAALQIQVVGATPGGADDEAAYPMAVFTVAPGRAISLTAASRDADGDTLAYAWDFGAAAAGGAIGPGGVATPAGSASGEWVTPPATARYDAPGVYRARVTVSDLRGRTSSASVLVRVSAGATTSPAVVAPGAAAAQNVITGRVLDALGAPLSDARVGDGSVWTYTDADGSYALAGLGPAPRTLAASSPGGWSVAPAGFDNPVYPGPATRGVDFRATPVGYQITGTVETNGGYSVKGVLVSDGTHSTLTDGAGSYSLPAGNGVYDLTFFKPGYPIADARGVVVDNGDASVRSVAQVTGVGGRVQGIPAGVTVTVSWGGGQGREEVIGGSYRFNEVPRGAHIVTATGRGRDGRLYNFSPYGWTNPLNVTGDEGAVDFIATPADMYTVSGRVTRGADGVAGASVTVVDKRNGDAVVASTVTDDSGQYVVGELLAGAYAVSARKPGVALSPFGRRFVLSSNLNAVDFRAPDSPPDLPPKFLARAAAEPARVTGVSTWLSADAEDDLDTDRLIYSWSVVSAPTGAAVTFHRNAANGARRTLATFDRPGVYELESTVQDTHGGRATSVATVTVVPVLSTLRVNPPYAVVAPGSARRFQAVALDQFGLPFDAAGEVSWAVAGSIGAVAPDGTFTASGSAAGNRGTLVARVLTPAGMEVVGSATVDVAPYAAAVSVAKRIRPQRPRQALEVSSG